jgi:hypothetical protein
VSVARRIGVTLVLAVCVQSLAASTPCASEKRSTPVNHKEYEELQEFVNAGHQPWRMDARAVAAEQVLLLEMVTKDDKDVYTLPLSLVEQDGRRAVFQFLSKRQAGVTYRITVRRFEWLFPLAEKWEWMIWVPTEATVTRCQVESNR